MTVLSIYLPLVCQLHLLFGTINCSKYVSGCCLPCREELFSEMMKEREDIATKRLSCHNAVKALREASAALEMLPVELLQQLQSPQPSSEEASEGAGQPQTAPRQGPPQGQPLQSFAQPARSPGRPRLGVAAGTHAAQLAMAAMAAASNDTLAMRRAESIANPFGYN